MYREGPCFDVHAQDSQQCRSYSHMPEKKGRFNETKTRPKNHDLWKLASSNSERIKNEPRKPAILNDF